MNVRRGLTKAKLTFKKQTQEKKALAELSVPSVAGRVKFFTSNIAFMSFTKIIICIVK